MCYERPGFSPVEALIFSNLLLACAVACVNCETRHVQGACTARNTASSTCGTSCPAVDICRDASQLLDAENHNDKIEKGMREALALQSAVIR